MKSKSFMLSKNRVIKVCSTFALSLTLVVPWGMQDARAQATGLWTWEAGSNGPNGVASYGTKGTPAASNVPGVRYGNSGGVGGPTYFWMFGGTDGFGNYLNDLWIYTPGNGLWTWISGLSTFNGTGVYGTKGIGVFGDMPGARFAQTSWTDQSGNFWIFGGFGYDGSGNIGYLNDLWKFNPGTFTWTWISGSKTMDTSGVYGTQGVPATGNVPGAREYSRGWTDASGNFWIFGGLGYAASGGGYLNDLWKYNPTSNQWTWVSGSNAVNQNGSYGTQGITAVSNMIPSRYAGGAAADASGNFWFFGGRTVTGLLNDLWKYNVSSGEWTWESGSSSVNNGGVYGSQGVAAASNIPGTRLTNIWFDASGNIWLFGGGGYDASGNLGLMNDVWEYSPAANQWAWVDGSTLGNSSGSYGTRGVSTLSNQPPAREVNASWVDAAGNVWVMGGASMYNDLWEYSPISVLALQELTLQGVSGGSQNILNWRTVGETNIARFVVGRTTDGINFSAIGSVIAVGNGNNDYSFTDADPPARTSLQYRIQAIDLAGKSSYSNVVLLTATPRGSVTLFPNPATSGVTLELGDASLLNTIAQLVDANGRVVQQQVITGQQQFFDLHRLTAGIYFLHLADGTSHAFVRKNGF